MPPTTITRPSGKYATAGAEEVDRVIGHGGERVRGRAPDLGALVDGVIGPGKDVPGSQQDGMHRDGSAS